SRLLRPREKCTASSCKRGQRTSSSAALPEGRFPFAVFLHALRHRADEIALGRSEKGIPDVEDENDARLVAPVPCLVLEGVVEHPGPALAPLPGLGAYAEAA